MHHLVELQVLAEARDRDRNLLIELVLVDLGQAPVRDHVLAGDEHVAHRIAGGAVDQIGDRIDQRLPFRTVGVEQHDVGLLADLDGADAVAHPAALAPLIVAISSPVSGGMTRGLIRVSL